MQIRSAVNCTLIVSILLIAPDGARAASYLVPDDGLLIEQADLIVRGRVLDGTSLRTATGGIATDVRVSVESVLKGSVEGGVIVTRQIGGAIGSDMEVYPGSGGLLAGEHVLLLLEERPGGPPRLLQFALGRFRIETSAGGVEYAWRPELRDSAAAGGEMRTEPARSLREFEDYITAIVEAARAASLAPAGTLPGSAAPPADYIRGDIHPPELSAAEEFELLALGGGVFARWSEFDSGGSVTYRYDAVGDVGCTGGCQAETAAGMAGWNADTSSDVNVLSGGTDASIGSKCLGQLSDEINYNDPCNDIGNLSGCSGTLALGGFSATSAPTSPGCDAKSTAPFYKIVAGRIMVNNGVGACLNSCNFQDMITHETGHTIGFGHSTDNTAIMAPFLVSGRCGVLQPDDIAGVACLYPTSGCVASDVASVKVKEKTGAGIVKLTLFGTTFSSGDTIQIDAGAGFVDVMGTIFKSSKKLKLADATAWFPDMSTAQVRVLKAGGCTGTSVAASR